MKKNNKNLTLKEYLKNLNQEEIDTYYDELPEKIKLKKKKMTYDEKVNLIASYLIGSYRLNIIFLTDEEIKELEDILNGKEVKKASKILLKNKIVFKIDNKYEAPLEVITELNYLKEHEVLNEKKDLIISFYLESNGILEISKLIELTKATGINVTKKEIIALAKKREYIIKNDLIYYDELALSIDEDNNINEAKKNDDYKVFTFEEMYAIESEFHHRNYEEKIKKILLKRIKDKDEASNISFLICKVSKIGYNYIETIEEALKPHKKVLTKEDTTEILKYAKEMYDEFPVWELNGYSNYIVTFSKDDLIDDDDFDFSESFSTKEQLDVYIHIYVMINGIIEINKLLEILNLHHDLKIRKKELVERISNMEELNLSDDYVSILSEDPFVSNLLTMKKTFKEYKIIEEVEKMLEEIYDNIKKIYEFSNRYDIPFEVMSEIEQMMRITGMPQIKLLEEILKSSGCKLPQKKFKKLYEELCVFQNELRLWSCNGFLKSEISCLAKRPII